MSRHVVLIDNGHGFNTPGKRSPDGKLLEYEYAREIAEMVIEGLRRYGINAIKLIPEKEDVPISERCDRANAIDASTEKDVILVSIHCNAAGLGKEWLSANGWQVCIYPKASQKSRKLASCLTKAADGKGVKIRRPLPNQDYWEQNLGICRDTTCPAVLTENLFMDNKKDVEFLLSEEGKSTIAQLHINGIMAYIDELLL